MRSFWVHHGTCIVKWDKGHEGWLCWSGFPWGLRPEEKISVWSQPRDFSPHSANPGGPWIVPRQWWQCRTRGVVEPIKSWQAEIDSSFQATLQPPTFSNSTLPTVFISSQYVFSGFHPQIRQKPSWPGLFLKVYWLATKPWNHGYLEEHFNTKC